MNNLMIIGNLTRDPELRTTQSGVSVCTFTVAVNRKYTDKNGNKTTDYIRVTAWRGLGESCNKYLAKGRKVAVSGEASARAYMDDKGEVRSSLELTAQDVEFLTPRQQTQTADPADLPPEMRGMEDAPDEPLPWE